MPNITITTGQAKALARGEDITISPEKKSLVWKPEGGDEYWYVDSSEGLIEDQWIYFEADRNRYEVGNCYKTEEEAQAALDHQKLLTKIRRRVIELNDGWEPEIGTEMYEFYYSKNDLHNLRIYNAIASPSPSPIGYLKTRELAEQLRGEFGDDLTSVLFPMFTK